MQPEIKKGILIEIAHNVRYEKEFHVVFLWAGCYNYIIMTEKK